MKTYTIPVPPRGFPIPPSWLNTFINKAVFATKNQAIMDQIRVQQQDGLPIGNQRTLVICACSLLAENGMRTVFPSPEVVSACMNSNALDSVSVSDIREPYREFMFYLPSEPSIFMDGGNGRRLICMIVVFHPTTIFILPIDDLQAPYPLAIPRDEMMVAESVRKTCDPQYQTNVPRETWSMAEKALNLASSMLLLMQSYPSYVHEFRSKHRSGGRARVGKHLRIGLPDSLARTIRVGMDHRGEHLGGTVAPHWRRGHWRRQPHGNRWAMEHPDVAPIIDHRGRACHMDWLIPVFVSGVAAPKPQGTISA